MTSEQIKLNYLSDNNIIKAEEAINSDKLQPIENNNMLSISYQYYEFAEKAYEEIIKDTTPCTSYIRFAENCYGFKVYGFYKSKNNKIYIIDSYIEDIQRVFIPDYTMKFIKNL